MNYGVEAMLHTLGNVDPFHFAQTTNQRGLINERKLARPGSETELVQEC